MWTIKSIAKKGDYIYARVPEHPNATLNNYVLLHRVIMENHIGRLLKPDEIIHHKDGNGHNNSIDNLEIMTHSYHSKKHGLERGKTLAMLKCPECKRIFVRQRNQTHLVKPTIKTFCSRKCNGIFGRKAHKNFTEQMQRAIDCNLIRIYNSTE